ncbi:hypothetical protein C8Q80DRAFT_1265618 [Daedaleopsis nitida]|nr:hypothetical protein C8Q80DRAFT_1265618 [Daedaleopsis nitida]
MSLDSQHNDSPPSTGITSSSMEDVQAAADAQPHNQNGEDTEADGPRYKMRTTTIGRRPGKEAGLAVRTCQEMQAEAQAKRATLLAVLNAKAEAQGAKDAKIRACFEELASLMDAKAREEIEEASYFDMAPIEDPEQIPHAAGESSRASNRESRTPAVSRRVPQREISPAQEDSSDGSSSESIRTSPVPRVTKSTMTAAQKRVVKQTQVRARLASHREHPQASATPARSLAPSNTDAFTPNWRQALRARHAESLTPSKAPSDPQAATKATPARQARMHTAYARNSSTPQTQWEDQDPDFEHPGGLTAEDINAGRSVVLKRASTPRSQVRLADIFDIQEGPTAPAEEKKRKNKKSEKTPKKSKKKGKKASKDSDCESGESGDDEGSNKPSRSIKYDLLPAWSKPRIKTAVVPSILNYLGAQDNPWSLETLKYLSFQELLQHFVDVVFPERQYQVERRDIIYRWSQHQVYEWHCGFQKAANLAIRSSKKERQEDPTLHPQLRTTQAIEIWLCEAIQRGGAAMFGRPNTATPELARDQLQSKFVLKAVAFHLAAIKGSVLPDEDGQEDPVGAIALAAAAVERAFLWYTGDHHKGVPQSPFSKDTAGALTGKWRETSVQDMQDKPHRLARLLSAATKMVKPAKEEELYHGPNHLYVRERSSSPVLGPFDDDEDLYV